MKPIRPKVKIQFVGSNETMTLNGSQLISFTCSENIMDSNLDLNPGICEQYANLEIYDKDGLIRQRGLKGELHKDDIITIIGIDENVWEEGGIAKGEVVLGDYLVEEWKLENNNSHIKIVCRDTSYRLDKINIPRTIISDRTVDDLLNIVFSSAPQMTWVYLDTDTEERCQNITIPNSWYKASDLKTMLESICAVGLLRIYYFNKTFFVGRCV